MRRLIPLLLLLSSCQRQPNPSDVVREESAELASGFATDEPVAASQMLHGFYNLEGAPWRWTKQSFGVLLHVPQPRCKLRLYFTLPEIVFSRLGPITLSASVNGTPLEPQTFSAEGRYVYTRDVQVNGDTAVVEFRTDKAVAPNVIDDRELAVIVSRVELTLP